MNLKIPPSLIRTDLPLVGDIILPDSAKGNQSKVVALGEMKGVEGFGFEFAVEIGDIVITKKLSGTEFECDDQKYKIVDQEEILAILEK